MSILIKNMDMPINCDRCWALDDNGDYPRCRITEEQRGYNFPIREKRMDKCPLIPTADVRVIKHGRWSFDNIIFTDADGVSRSGVRGYKCSECNGFCIGESNFCPNCGADMREEN